MGCALVLTAAATPQQNATTERHGGLWKAHARKLIDQFSIRFDNPRKVIWMIASVTWAMNSSINESGYSPSQWVLGRGLRLPYCLLDQAGRLSLHERVVSDKPFSERIGMMQMAAQSVANLRHNQTLSRAILARSRAEGAQHIDTTYQMGDQVFYWRGNGRPKREWANA